VRSASVGHATRNCELATQHGTTIKINILRSNQYTYSYTIIDYLHHIYITQSQGHNLDTTSILRLALGSAVGVASVHGEAVLPLRKQRMLKLRLRP
jgi:hypothetical protein